MTTAEIATAFAERGWFVLPCYAKAKTPYFPIAKRGYKSASNDIDTVSQWFAGDKLNIGIACAPSNLVVFDVDFRNGGTTDGLDLETFTVATGDGLHLYYQTNREVSFPGKLREGVDIKFNGYVIGAGSIHPNGKFYEVVKDIEPAPVMGWV